MPQAGDGDQANQRLQLSDEVRAVAAECVAALAAWEKQTRVTTPTVATLSAALDQPLARLEAAFATANGEENAAGICGLHCTLMASVAKREHVPRGDTPWGDYAGGCDTALHLLAGALEEWSGQSSSDPELVQMLILRECMPVHEEAQDPPRRRGHFIWNDRDSVLAFGNIWSTPFPKRSLTPRRILRLLAKLPSHRAHLTELDRCFTDPNYPRDHHNIDPHLNCIRRWIRSQPHPIWRAVDIKRIGDRVELSLDVSGLLPKNRTE